jgi:hypothetical protein
MIAKDLIPGNGTKSFAIMKSLVLVSQPEVTPVSADSIAPCAKCFLE